MPAAGSYHRRDAVRPRLRDCADRAAAGRRPREQLGRARHPRRGGAREVGTARARGRPRRGVHGLFAAPASRWSRSSRSRRCTRSSGRCWTGSLGFRRRRQRPCAPRSRCPTRRWRTASGSRSPCSGSSRRSPRSGPFCAWSTTLSGSTRPRPTRSSLRRCGSRRTRSRSLFAARDDAERPFVAAGLPELRPAASPRRRAPPPRRPARAASSPSTSRSGSIRSANGNPLALIELPSALSADQLGGREPLAGAAAAADDRGAGLCATGRAPARVGADGAPRHRLRGRGDRAAVTRRSRARPRARELVVAESDGLVRVGRSRIDFCHPLARSAVYRSAGFVEREEAHRALAAVLSGDAEVDRRAWHLAAATVGTDPDVAAELERTADRARVRGGPGAAVAALERAAELTDDPEEKGRRLVLAAQAAWHGGLPGRATALAATASPLVSVPAAQGRARTPARPDPAPLRVASRGSRDPARGRGPDRADRSAAGVCDPPRRRRGGGEGR